MLRTRRIVDPLLAAISVLAVLTCSPPAADVVWETTADLTARFSVATTNSDTAVIDFGVAAARPHLVSGWSEDRVDANGLSHVSSVGERSTLSFFLGTPEEVQLRFRCRPQQGIATVQSMTLELNGLSIATIALEGRLRTYSVDLPTQHLHSGKNRLAFIYGGDGRSAPEESLPAVNWFRLDFGDRQGPEEPPAAEPGLQVLFLPFGAQVDFPVITGPRSRLWIDRVDIRGGTDPALQVELVSDEGSVTLAAIDSPREATALDLGTTLPDALILTVRAESASSWNSGDGIYLRQPQIQEPAGPIAELSSVEQEPPEQPNILIYLVDTLRSDRLSTYGHAQPTSPRLDEFAAGATLFEKAIGQSTWTRPSVASVFTGQWPAAHSVIKRRDALSDEAATIAESLQRAGYTTAGFSDNVNISKAFGFAQGFDHFELNPQGADSTDINAAVFDWLDNRPPDQPFFLYVQPADPHNPYLPREPFRSRFAAEADEVYELIQKNPSKEVWQGDSEIIRQLLALYDSEVAANDASFGHLLDRLDELELFDDMLIMFLSDHGEEFHERGGWNHGRTLHTETLDFPLVIKMPGQRQPRRVAEVVQHVDIPSTIADLVGFDAPAGAEGRSLLPLMRGESKAALSSAPGYSHVELVRGLATSIVVGEWKLIDRRRRTGRRTRLFHWTEDPTEQHDLADQFPVRTAALQALLEEKLTTQTTDLTSEEAQLDPELEQRLRALGYL